MSAIEAAVCACGARTEEKDKLLLGWQYGPSGWICPACGLRRVARACDIPEGELYQPTATTGPMILYCDDCEARFSDENVEPGDFRTLSQLACQNEGWSDCFDIGGKTLCPQCVSRTYGPSGQNPTPAHAIGIWRPAPSAIIRSRLCTETVEVAAIPFAEYGAAIRLDITLSGSTVTLRLPCHAAEQLAGAISNAIADAEAMIASKK